MALLRLHKPDKTNEDFDLDPNEATLVGRALENTVTVGISSISRKHFVIEPKGGQFELANTSRTHGTYVNGKLAERVVLKPNDQIAAGDARFTFLIEAPVRPTVASSADEAGPDADLASAQTPASQPQAAAESAAPGEDVKDGGQDELDDAILISGEASKDATPDLMATSDPGESTIDKALESAIDERPSEEWRKRLLMLQNIGQQMTTRLQLDELLEFFLAKIFEALPADNGVILLADAETNRLRPKAIRLSEKGRGSVSRAGGPNAKKLRVSQTLLRYVFQRRVGVLSADAQSDDRFAEQHSILAFGIRSVMCVPMLYQDEILGAIHVDCETVRNSFTKQDLDLLTMMASQAALCVHNAWLHDRIVREQTHLSNLKRYFSPQVASQIANNEIQLDAGGTSVEVTILYSDIRNFTPLSERVSPEELVRFLNEYFTLMADIVFECKGTFDKYIGDALMAVFGSPVPDPEGAWNAARCAELMIQRLEETTFDIGPVSIGIGLHKGPVIHGNIGSELVMQYTVIGDTVNVTARLSDVAAPNQIVLSPEMVSALGDRVETTPLGPVELKGVSEPMELHALGRLR